MIKILSAVIIAFVATTATGGAATVSQNLNIIITKGGGPITTVTFQNDSGSTLPAGTPVSLGQGFAYGDIMPGTHPLIRDAATHTALVGQQWNEISTWRENGGNGSWRHAVWAAWLPTSLAAGATTQFEIVSAAGAYSETSHQPLTALCSGPAAHDLKIHLTDIRNVDDTVRDSGDATFRVCDNIANTGRDAPRHLDAGNVMDEYVVSGLFTYTSGKKDPLLYAQCIIDIFTQASDGTSAGDVRWVCHDHNSWMNVSAGSTGNTGNPGPAGFANDPQFISYRAEVDDGSTDVLDWSGLDASLTSASNPVIAPNASTCILGRANSTNCLFVPSSTGANAWYYGQFSRVSCTGTCVGNLTNGQGYFVFPTSSASTGGADTRYVGLTGAPTGGNDPLTTSQGTGTTAFSMRIPHAPHKTWETVDATGLSNWSPFGSATRVTRKVYPVMTTAEKQYWEKTGLIVPIDVNQTGLPDNLVDYSLGLGITYAPMGDMDMIGGGGVGARADIGIANEYSAKALVTQAASDWDNARLASYCAPRDGFATTLNEATGRIPVLNNGPPTGIAGNGNGGSYTGLGSGTVTSQAHIPPGFLNGMADPAGKLNPAGFDPSAGIIYTGLDHMPAFAGFTYMVFGDRQFLDMIQLRAENDVMQVAIGPADPGQGGFRDNTAPFTDGNVYHYWGLLTNSYQGRGNAWLMRDVTYAGAFGADDYPLAPTFAGNPERSYFGDMITETGNYWPRWLDYKDGPGSVGYTGSLWPPSSDDYDTAYKEAYLSSAGYIMTTFLHAPMGEFIEMPMQKIYEARVGGQMYGHVPTYYGVEYEVESLIKDGDHQTPGGGGGVGPFANGVDAADWGSNSDSASILTGGQLQTSTNYTVANGDQMKTVAGWYLAPYNTVIDQLPGNRWFTFTNANAANATFSLLCTSADHTAFPTQCPVAGQAFTGFTSGGVAISNAGNALYPKFRFAFDPGPGQGYLGSSYIPYMQQAIHGLHVLGYDTSHSQTDLTTRAGSGFNTNTPQFDWDPTVTVPGLPPIVTHTHEFATLSCGVSPGTVVDTMGLTGGATPGTWTIFKTSDPTHYAISGSNLVTVGTLPCDASQMVQVKNTPSGGREVIGEMHLHVNP